MSNLLFDPNAEGGHGNVWTESKLLEVWDVIEKLAVKYGLKYNECDLVRVTQSEMLDLYVNNGLPEYPTHWTQGMDRESLEHKFSEGQMGLALEIVVNTDPVQLYVMSNNTMTVQTMVLAHAGPGHGSFFKNNYLFKERTNANSIRRYLRWASNYIHRISLKYGDHEVSVWQNYAIALMWNSIDRYKRPRNMDRKRQEADLEWRLAQESSFDELNFEDNLNKENELSLRDFLDEEVFSKQFNEQDILHGDTEENLLYFLEKNSDSPKAMKEVFRIYRKIAEYFYPQKLTKIMNEGWASFWHYTLMYDLYDQGYINDASMQEFIDYHCRVINHIDSFEKLSNIPLFHHINPYTLGFYIFRDLRRVCEFPTSADYKEFPDIAGTDWVSTLKHVAYNYKDSEFILKFLSSKVIKDLKLYVITDDYSKDYIILSHAHTDLTYDGLKTIIAERLSFDYSHPQMYLHDYNPVNKSVKLSVVPYLNRSIMNEDTISAVSHFAEIWRPYILEAGWVKQR